MDSKKIIIGIVIVAVIGGGVYFVSSGKSSKTEQATSSQTVEEKVETVSAQDLGLTLVARSDKKAVKLEITKITGIASIDYELSYLAKGDLPRGVIGHLEVKSTDKKIASDYLDLGSCSRSVCKYDEGVSSVTLVLKITTKDGKILQAEKELEL